MNLVLILSYLFASTILFGLALSHVRKFNQINYDKWLDQDNLLIVLFCERIADGSCAKELELLNKLSDEMAIYTDLVFGYIDKETDAILFSRYDILKLPAVKLFPYNFPAQSYSPMNLEIQEFKKKVTDVRNENFEKAMMAKSTAKSNSQIKRKSIVEIVWSDLDATVKDPERHAILILYDGVCTDKCGIIEKVADIFRDEDEVGFFKMSLDKTGPLRNSFSFSNNPSIFWYPKDDKNGLVYRGMISLEVLTEYVNDRAGLFRNYNGHLKENAGRIAEIDEIIKENIMSILSKSNIGSIIQSVQKTSKKLPFNNKYAEYYLAILREIKKGTDPNKVLNREQDFLNKKISKTSSNKKEYEDWKKFYNIITAFVDFAASKIQENRAKKIKEKQDSESKKKGKEFGGSMPADLKEDPQWKSAWKHQSRHDEL